MEAATDAYIRQFLMEAATDARICVLWTRWKSSVAVTNGTRLACSTGWVTCSFERMLYLLALSRVPLMEAHLQQRLYPRTWH